MKKRIITGIVIAAVLLTVCRFSDTPVFAVLFTFLSAIGVFEMLGCIGVRKEKRITVLSLLFSLLATLLAKIVTNESEYVSFLVSGAFLYLLLLFAFSVFSKGKVPVDDVVVAGDHGAFAVVDLVAVSAAGIAQLDLLIDIHVHILYSSRLYIDHTSPFARIRRIPDTYSYLHASYFGCIRLFLRSFLRQAQAYPRGKPEKDRGGKYRRDVFLRSFVLGVRRGDRLFDRK